MVKERRGWATVPDGTVDADEDDGHGQADRDNPLATPARTGADQWRAGHPGLDRSRGAHPVPDQPALSHRSGHREPIRRYEHDHPGSMIHVDVTKFGNIPDGGGHKFRTRQQSQANAQVQASRTGERGREYRPRIGTAFLQAVIDDHSRVAYVEICTVEKLPPRSASLSALSPGSLRATSPSSGSCLTTDPPTDPLHGVTPARNSVPRTSGPAPTGRRPTGRSSASDAPSPIAGPTHASTGPTLKDAKHYPAGCTSTIIIGSTPPSAAHPSADSTICLDITINWRRAASDRSVLQDVAIAGSARSGGSASSS